MKVAYSELEDAFIYGSNELQHWLDKQTGKVILISSDTEHYTASSNHKGANSHKETHNFAAHFALHGANIWQELKAIENIFYAEREITQVDRSSSSGAGEREKF